MKYLITESQAKTTAAFLKLDMKNFIQIDDDDKIYFVYSEDDKYAQIVYDKKGWCFINGNLIDEISLFFSLKFSDSEKVIERWVEDTLKMKIQMTLARHPKLLDTPTK